MGIASPPPELPKCSPTGRLLETQRKEEGDGASGSIFLNGQATLRMSQERACAMCLWQWAGQHRRANLGRMTGLTGLERTGRGPGEGRDRATYSVDRNIYADRLQTRGHGVREAETTVWIVGAEASVMSTENGEWRMEHQVEGADGPQTTLVASAHVCIDA